MRLLFVSIFIPLAMMTTMDGQNFDAYRWKNRLLLILSEHEDSKLFKQQIKILDEDPEGLKERKLQIFKILRDKSPATTTEKRVVINKNLFSQYCKADEPFKIVLIGLDGQIKLEQDTLLTQKTLYPLIDAMPMRRAEMKNKWP